MKRSETSEAGLRKPSPFARLRRFVPLLGGRSAVWAPATAVSDDADPASAVALLQREIFAAGLAQTLVPALMHWLSGREKHLAGVPAFVPFLRAIEHYDAQFGSGELKKAILGGRFAADFVPQVLRWLERRSPVQLRQFPEFVGWFDAIKGYAARFGEAQLLARQDEVFPVAYLTVENYRVNSADMAPVEAAVAKLASEEIEALFGRDLWLLNIIRSLWEFAHARTRLTTYPWNISLPIADICNARCNFCTSWLEGRELISLEQIDALGDAIRHALYLGLVGHGEPMAHPKFREIADKLSSLIDRRATLYTITNGYFLAEMFEELRRLNIMSYSISLNAASAAVHDEVMGLGADGFERVLAGIRKLVALRDTTNSDLRIYITMVVTAQNIHEAANFVRLGNELRVTEIWLRSLLPQSSPLPGLNYHVLPPFTHPRFAEHQAAAIEAIVASKVPVQADPPTWRMDALSPSLREEVTRNPPALIRREDALRDRDLRRRNQHLYAQDRVLFRGQRRNDAGTTVTISGGELHFTTPTAPYSFAADIAVTRQLARLDGPQPQALEVTFKVSDGVVGVGLLDAARDRFVDRQFLRAGFDGVVNLDLPAGIDARLIIENGDEQRGASRGLIRRVAAVGSRSRADDAIMNPGTVSHPLDLVTYLKVHNAEDPLEDGLNPLGRTPRLGCRAVHYNLYINEMFFRVNPCCYMQNVPGFQEIRFDGSTDFMEAWNSPALVDLRTKLRDGPLYAACRRCPEKW